MSKGLADVNKGSADVDNSPCELPTLPTDPLALCASVICGIFFCCTLSLFNPPIGHRLSGFSSLSPADGPDQVHMMALGKQLIQRYAD